MTSSEILAGLRNARKFALECDYNSAIAFYDGLDGEMETHIRSLKQRGEDSTKWELLRIKTGDERNHIVQLQIEIQAIINPAAAVRLDRAQQQQQHGGYNNGDDASWPSSQQRLPPAGRYPPPPRNGPPALQQGSPAQRFDSSMNNNAENINEQLYGDPLKFGPGFVPLPVVGGFGGGGGGGQRRAASNPAGVQRRRENVPPPSLAAGRAAAAAAAGGGGGMGRQQPSSGDTPPPRGAGGGGAPDKKPAVPKFGGGGSAAGAGAGAPNNNNNNNNNRGLPPQRGRGNNHDNKPVRQRFCPRPGEEEFAAAIEAELLHETGIKFADIAGQEEAKRVLEEAVVYPALMPEYYTGLRRPSKGVLLYGPPGTGKTLLARAVAGEGKTTFFNISHATLTSKWRGDSEKLIRVLFEMARFYAPSTIFIDEIDALTSDRGDNGMHEASKRAVSMLLTQMDGAGIDHSKAVMVLGATNHPETIDTGILRRLEQRVYIPLPTHDDRIELLKLATKDIKLAKDVNFEALSAKLENRNYSGADMTTMCRDAAMYTMRRFLEDATHKEELKRNPAEVSRQLAEEPISMQDFLLAAQKVPSSVDAKQIKKFEAWKQQYHNN